MTSVDAAQWRAAADAIEAAFTGPDRDRQARYAAAYLRRRADMQQVAEARPPIVNYVVEVYDDLAEEWMASSSRTTDQDEATATMRRHRDKWGRAARVVEAVETYGVIACVAGPEAGR